MTRRRFLSQLVGLPFLALGARAQESKRAMKIMGTCQELVRTTNVYHVAARRTPGHPNIS